MLRGIGPQRFYEATYDARPSSTTHRSRASWATNNCGTRFRERANADVVAFLADFWRGLYSTTARGLCDAAAFDFTRSRLISRLSMRSDPSTARFGAGIQRRARASFGGL